MQVPRLERDIGIEVYATQSLGIGGKIRQLLDDFVVEELLVDGSLAKVSPPTESWEPADEGRYLICVLVKRKWDTFLAMRKVAEKLRISQKRIRFAGIKDTKALTAQYISLQGVSPNRVAELVIKDIGIYPKRFSRERMYSQLIQGNRFHITIRDIVHSASVIEERVERIQEEIVKLGGVPNFFGHQRFGTIRPNTHQIGKYLTMGNAERAALAFLAEPTEHENPEAREARQQLQETMDYQQAFNLFPRFLRYERFMLSHLAKCPKDFVGAFRELPRRLRKLFVQAYQSYLFNRFLSERILRGIPLNEPQVGDYVVNFDEHGLPTEKTEKVTKQNLQVMKKAIKARKIGIAIPLVGTKQPPSEGIQGEIEQEILENEKVDLKNFKLSFMPEATAPGRVRIIINPVKNLILEEIAADSENKGKQMMKLGFILNRGSYATVLLREFMKSKDLIEAGY